MNSHRSEPAGSGPLEVVDLRKEYPTPAGPLVVLDGIDFQLSPGEPLVILGPSGSGKSTLLFILGALEAPTGGSVRLCGVDPHSLAEREQAEFRNRQVGFIFQDHHLLPHLTLLENVLVPALLRPPGDSLDTVERARLLISRVGLEGRMHHRPAELSGGERQRAAIARALVGRPTLVLADEPTGNLDRMSAREVGELLRDLQGEENAILVLVTHSQELAERFPRRVELVGGKLQDV